MFIQNTSINICPYLLTKKQHIPVSNLDNFFYEIIIVEIYMRQASLPFLAQGVQKGYKANRT